MSRPRPTASTKFRLGRYGKASEVAEAVLFFASDRASFISSASLMVSGAR
ncbi:MAG: SDR family oxidoreductase [Alphaproteobacteria bacterium]